MNRNEFSECMKEAATMFNGKPLSPYVQDEFWEEFGSIERIKFMKALAVTAANGARLTVDNISEAIFAMNRASPKLRVKTDCGRCSGDGAITVDGYAYSCTCNAAVNHPNLRKYTGGASTGSKITDMGDYYLREFDRYKVTVPKNIKTVKEICFTID